MSIKIRYTAKQSEIDELQRVLHAHAHFNNGAGLLVTESQADLLQGVGITGPYTIVRELPCKS